MAKYNLDTPIKDIIADPAAKAALASVAPKLAENPMLSGLPMGLKQVAGFAGGKLTPERLAEIEKALAAVE